MIVYIVINSELICGWSVDMVILPVIGRLVGALIWDWSVDMVISPVIGRLVCDLTCD